MVVKHDIKSYGLGAPSLGRTVENPNIAEGGFDTDNPLHYLRGDGSAFGWRTLQLGDIAKIGGATVVVAEALQPESEGVLTNAGLKLTFRPMGPGDLNYRGQIALDDLTTEAPHSLPFKDPLRTSPKPGEFKFFVSERTGRIAAFTYHLASKHWRSARYGDCIGSHGAFTQRTDDGKRISYLLARVERQAGFEQGYQHNRVVKLKKDLTKATSIDFPNNNSIETDELIKRIEKEFAGDKKILQDCHSLRHARIQRDDFVKIRELAEKTLPQLEGYIGEIVAALSKSRANPKAAIDDVFQNSDRTEELFDNISKLRDFLSQRLRAQGQYVKDFLQQRTEAGRNAENDERYEKWRAWVDFKDLHEPLLEAMDNIKSSLLGENLVDGFVRADGSISKVMGVTIPGNFFKGKIWNKDGSIITPGDLRWASNINSVWDEAGRYGPPGRWVHARRGIMGQAIYVTGETIYETVYGDSDLEAERAASGTEQRDMPGMAAQYIVCWNGITWRDRQAADLVLAHQEGALLRTIFKPIARIAKSRLLGINAREQKFIIQEELREKEHRLTYSEPGDTRRILESDSVTGRNEHTWVAKEREFEIARSDLSEAIDIDFLTTSDGEEKLIEPIRVPDIYKTDFGGRPIKERVWALRAAIENVVFGGDKEAAAKFEKMSIKDLFLTKVERPIIYARSKVSPFWYISALTALGLLDKYEHTETQLDTPDNAGKRVVSTTRVWEAEYANARGALDMKLGLMKLAYGGPAILIGALAGASVALKADMDLRAGNIVLAGTALSAIWSQVYQLNATKAASGTARQYLPDELRDRKSEFAVVPRTSLCGWRFHKQAIAQAWKGFESSVYTSFGARIGRKYADIGVFVGSAIVAFSKLAEKVEDFGPRALWSAAIAGVVVAVTSKLVSVERGEQQTLKYIKGEPDKAHPLYQQVKESGVKSLSAEQVTAHGLPYKDGIKNPTKRNWIHFVREARLRSELTGQSLSGIDKDFELR